jgi:type VI protein secretion system component Hcp
MKKIVQGKHFPKVAIVMLKQTGAEDGQGEPYFGIRMEEAFITKVSSKGAEDGSVTQDIEMVFKVIAVGYSPQALKGGSIGTQVNFVWDIGKMETEGPPAVNLKTPMG